MKKEKITAVFIKQDSHTANNIQGESGKGKNERVNLAWKIQNS